MFPPRRWPRSASYDLLQRRHAILRDFSVVGHGRSLLESIGPELRQYITTRNDEERPFTRDQRRWVYASSKRVTNTFGFGTDSDIEFTDGYTIIKHRTFSQFPPPRPRTPGSTCGFRRRRSSAGRAAARKRSGRTRSSIFGR